MGDGAGCTSVFCALTWVEYILDWIVILCSPGLLSGGGGCITK